jgi:ferritin
MKFADHLSKEQKKELSQIQSPKKKCKKKKQNAAPVKKEEKLSRNDILELMGVNRDTYVRSKGAIRRK